MDKITHDDVLDLHLALQDFDGNFNRLFAQLEAHSAMKEYYPAQEELNRRAHDGYV